MARVVLSAVVLIVTNLIVGSISISLGLIVAVALCGVAAAVILLFAVLGFCIALEKAGWLRPGWTDDRIDRLKHWAEETWRSMPRWYREEKKRIIEMLIQTLQGKEKEVDQPVRTWRTAGIGLIVLLAIVLAKTSLHLSTSGALAVVALGSVLVAVPMVYLKARRNDKIKNEGPCGLKTAPAVPCAADPSEQREVSEALKVLLELHRSGRLDELRRK